VVCGQPVTRRALEVTEPSGLAGGDCPAVVCQDSLVADTDIEGVQVVDGEVAYGLVGCPPGGDLVDRDGDSLVGEQVVARADVLGVDPLAAAVDPEGVLVGRRDRRAVNGR